MQAYLRAGETTYYASVEPNESSPICTPVTKLIQGIYEREPEMARKILRNRVFSTAAATPLCKAMVKVSAKRLTENAAALTAEEKERAVRIEFKTSDRCETASNLGASVIASDVESKFDALVSLRDRKKTASVNTNRYENDRAVVATLSSPAISENAMPIAFNTNAKNRTLHAEMNLVHAMFARGLSPFHDRVTVFVTLKPCRMCATALASLVVSPSNLRVIYLENDPGPGARYPNPDYLIESLHELKKPC